MEKVKRLGQACEFLRHSPPRRWFPSPGVSGQSPYVEKRFFFASVSFFASEKRNDEKICRKESIFSFTNACSQLFFCQSPKEKLQKKMARLVEEIPLTKWLKFPSPELKRQTRTPVITNKLNRQSYHFPESTTVRKCPCSDSDVSSRSSNRNFFTPFTSKLFYP